MYSSKPGGCHCAFDGCFNNSRSTPPEIKYHPFTKPCSKVSKGREEFTESHLRQCPTCTKCNRWLLIGQGTKKWPKSLKEINRNHYLCSLHFVNGHPHSDRFPDPLPATSVLEVRLQNKRKQAFEENVHPAKRRSALITTNVQSQIFSNTENTTDIKHFMMSPVGSQTCEISSNEHNSTTPYLAKTLHNNNMTTRSQQTTFMWNDIEKLKEENEQLLKENATLKKKLLQAMEERNAGVDNLSQFVKSLKKNDVKCKFYTNLKFEKIVAFLNFLSPHDNIHYWKEKKIAQPNSTARSHTHLEELVLVLVRLRTGLSTQDLAYRFGVSQGFITNIFITWVQHAYCKLDIVRPSMFVSRDIIQKNLPVHFRNMKNVRVTIHRAEIYCQAEAPSNVEHLSHKAHSTFKVLLGCTPSGAVSFVSDLFDGSISDEELVKQSKLLDLLDEDDLVLADRGIAIKELTGEKNVVSHIPPFLHGHANAVVKLKQFRLLRKVLPQNVHGILSQVVFVCACLLNYQELLNYRLL